jgi:hypothetical protein
MNASPDATAPHTPPQTPAPQAETGRVAAGRFAKGNPGGPGNPYYRRQAQLKRVLLDAITDDEVRSVLQVLLGLARGGDLAAVKLYLQYAVGNVDPDRADLHEWQLHQQTPRLPQVGELMAQGIETGEANRVARDVVPIVGACHLQTISQHLRSGTDLNGHRIAPSLEETAAATDGGKRPSASAQRMSAGVRASDLTGDNGEDEERAWSEMLDEDLADAVQTGEIDLNEVFLRSHGLGPKPGSPADDELR